MRHAWWIGLALMGCVAEFPSVAPVSPVSVVIDGGPLDGGWPDGALPDDGVIDGGARDASPRPDMAPDPDDGVPPADMRVEPDLSTGCQIEAEIERIVLRTWNAERASDQVKIRTDCEGVQAELPDWVSGGVEGDTLTVAVDAERGVRDGEIVLRAPDAASSLTLPVRGIGLTAGGDTRRALIYVVDGFKGDTLANSRPPALDWLSKHATRLWEAVPHGEVGQPTREGAWASLLSGLAPTAHGFDGGMRMQVPTFADRVGTRFAAQWRVISEAIEQPVADDAAAVIAAAVEGVNSDAPLVIAGVDGLLGLGPAELAAANMQIDADLDALLAAIAERPISEDWLIVVTAATSGSDNAPALPLVYAAPTQMPVMIEKASLMDVHTSVLRWLRVLRPGWDLPGEQILGGVEVRCADGEDNDGDGRIDCRDADCAGDCVLGCVQTDIRMATGPGVFSANLDAGRSVNIACAGRNAESLDLAVRWTAPRDGPYLFSTYDSRARDPVIDIKREHCGGDRLACNDDIYNVDGPEPAGALVPFFEGQSAIVFLTDFGRDPPLDRPMRLSIAHPQTECENAPLFEGERMPLSNHDRFFRMPPISNDEEQGDRCGRATAQALVRWRAQPGEWRLNVQADFDASLSIWRTPCDALQASVCVNAPGGVLAVDEAREYLLVVASTWRGAGAPGAFSLSITPAERE